LKIGMSRARARHVLRRFSTHGRRYEDFFCLSPVGIRAGYASGRLVASLSHAQRQKLIGRIVLLLTADRLYTLRRIPPGTSLKLAAQRVRLGRPIKLGPNTWYIVPNGSSVGVLKVRHGVVEEVGIAERTLFRTNVLVRRVLRILG
jgi:hypothetical protein